MTKYIDHTQLVRVFRKLHQPAASPLEIMRKLPQPSVSLAKKSVVECYLEALSKKPISGEKSVFECYLEALRKKSHYTEDPYLLYEITQYEHKDYNIYGIVPGFEIGNHTFDENRKTFDITYNGRSETIVIWKDRTR